MALRNRGSVFALSVGLILTAVACNLRLSISELLLTSTPTPSRSAEAEVESEPGEATLVPSPASESAAPTTFDLDALEEYQYPVGVDTYRVVYNHRFEGDVSGAVVAEGAVQTDPAASSYLERSEGAAKFGGPESVEGRLLDGILAARTGPTCTVTIEETAGSPIPAVFYLPMPSRYLTGEAELAEAGIEINGRLTDRYSLDVSDFDRTVPGFLDIVRLDLGNLYLDAKEGFLVKLEFEGFGKNTTISLQEEEAEGVTSYLLSYEDFGEPIQIEPLPDCGPIPDTSYPVLQEHLYLYSTDGQEQFFELSYNARFEEVLSFYKTELAADGWTLNEELSFEEGEATLDYTGPDGLSLSVDIRDNSPTSAEETGRHAISVSILRFNFGQ